MTINYKGMDEELNTALAEINLNYDSKDWNKELVNMKYMCKLLEIKGGGM